MQPFEKNKIPNKYHPFKTEDISLEQDPNDAIQAKDRKIAKYAPRVLKSYLMTYMNDRPFISAIKRVKKIRFIHDDIPRYQHSKHQWRLLLQNKLKSVMIYDNRENGWETLKKYKAFSNITQVLLQDNNINKGLMRYLPGMVNLKCLDFLINPETPSNLLKKLNSMPKVVSRLETMKIEWSNTKDEEEENNIPFSCLAENINVVKNLTHLSIDGIQEDVFLEQLPEDCKNLVFLSAKFCEASPDMHRNYLEVLENFEKLKKITIFPDNLGLFIENFTLPSSIKHLCVNFGEDVTWDKALLEDSSRLANFSEKWKKLTNLVSLRISATHKHKERKRVQAFIEFILKSVSNIINLELDLQLPNTNAFKDDEKNPINLAQIFLACQNYSDKLEEIKLTLPTQYPLICPSVEGIHFPKLKLLQLQKNRILNTETLENLFEIIKKSLPHENIVRILLDKFALKEDEAMIYFLELLMKSPRNSKVELTIEVKSLPEEVHDNEFEKIIEKMKRNPVVQNVLLEVRFRYPSEAEALSFLTELFENIRISYDPYGFNRSRYYTYYTESSDEDGELDDDG